MISKQRHQQALTLGRIEGAGSFHPTFALFKKKAYRGFDQGGHYVNRRIIPQHTKFYKGGGQNPERVFTWLLKSAPDIVNS